MNVNIDEQTLRQYNVIKPPIIQDVESNLLYTRIIVDSKERDTNQYPNPNSYYINLDDDIDDVIEVKLISADVQLNNYLINENNKTLKVTYNGILTTVNLDLGDYTGATLASMIQSNLNSQITSVFIITYNAAKDNFSFVSDSIFSLDFTGTKTSLSQILGFSNKVYTSDITNTIKSEYKKNFNIDKTSILYIDQFDLNKGISNIMNKSFALIRDNYSSLNISEDAKIVKRFNPILKRLARLHIQFYDRYGNPYDFQNAEHILELLFISYKQKTQYNRIFS